MTQDERWFQQYNGVVNFIITNHRNPSKFMPEERGLYCNWIKHNKKLMKAGGLKPEGDVQRDFGVG